MSETIIIDNVNTELLDEQRLALVRVLFAVEDGKAVIPEDVELVTGILHMLDHWSDNYKDKKHAPKPPINRKR